MPFRFSFSRAPYGALVVANETVPAAAVTPSRSMSFRILIKAHCAARLTGVEIIIIWTGDGSRRWRWRQRLRTKRFTAEPQRLRNVPRRNRPLITKRTSLSVKRVFDTAPYRRGVKTSFCFSPRPPRTSGYPVRNTRKPSSETRARRRENTNTLRTRLAARRPRVRRNTTQLIVNHERFRRLVIM